MAYIFSPPIFMGQLVNAKSFFYARNLGDFFPKKENSALNAKTIGNNLPKRKGDYKFIVRITHSFCGIIRFEVKEYYFD